MKTVNLDIPHDPSERARRNFLVGREDRLLDALTKIKCHLYAQSAMTDKQIIVACRVLADEALTAA